MSNGRPHAGEVGSNECQERRSARTAGAGMRSPLHGRYPAGAQPGASRARPFAHMRTCVRMTSQGSPYARFQRALQGGNLLIIRAAAAGLPPHADRVPCISRKAKATRVRVVFPEGARVFALSPGPSGMATRGLSIPLRIGGCPVRRGVPRTGCVQSAAMRRLPIGATPVCTATLWTCCVSAGGLLSARGRDHKRGGQAHVVNPPRGCPPHLDRTEVRCTSGARAQHRGHSP